MFSNKVLKILLAFLGLVVLVTAGFGSGYWYRGRIPPREIETKQETSGNNCAKPLLAPDTSQWKIYRNEELGFEIKYPDELSIIKPLDYSQQIKEYFSEYTRKCESGEIEGCGGGPLPRYMFKFQTFYQEKLKSTDKSPFIEPDEFSISVYDTNAVLGQGETLTGRTGIRWARDKVYMGGLAEKSQASYTAEAPDGFTYMINFAFKYSPEEYLALTDAIVSTFKFLK
jgi:hypothetical protein